MKKLKLAEALLLRADLQKKLASLRERLVANAVVQEGSKPSEDPNELLKTSFSVQKELEALVVRINRTNLAVTLDDGRTTLTDAIAHRETLAAQHALLTTTIAASRKEPERYGVREIKWVATLKVAGLQKQADDLAVKLRELNGRIQKTNWDVVLVD